MYRKYHTEALILAAHDHGEADKRFSLYTRDFGLVRARCSGVRTETSRMRCALQGYAYTRLSLVRGQTGWRVTGAQSIAHIGGRHDSADTFARLARLALQLISGEEQNAYLFNVLVGAHQALREGEHQVQVVELACVARMLFGLGYLEALTLGEEFAHQPSYSTEAIERVEERRTLLLSAVNQALGHARR